MLTNIALVVAILACWGTAKFCVPDDPNAKWVPGAKMTVTLVVAGVLDALVLMCSGALVFWRSNDVCVSHMPGMGGYGITSSVNIFTGSATCKYERDGREIAVKLPFGDFL